MLFEVPFGSESLSCRTQRLRKPINDADPLIVISLNIQETLAIPQSHAYHVEQLDALYYFLTIY